MKLNLMGRINGGKIVDRKITSNFKLRIVGILTAVGLIFGAVQPAYAFFGYDFDYTSNWLEDDLLRRTYENHNNVFKNSSSSKGSSSKGNSSKGKSTTSGKTTTASKKKSKITFKSDGSTKALDELVARYPSKQRAEARKVMSQLYNSFPQVARSVGIPTNDISSGMAAVLAGAYMAYNNTSLNDSYMKPLANQFKEAFQNTEEFDRMSDSQRKYMYDGMVIIGMMLAVTQAELQQKPNAKVQAQMRQAGKEVLEAVLGVNASKVRITSSGLVIN